MLLFKDSMYLRNIRRACEQIDGYPLCIMCVVVTADFQPCICPCALIQFMFQEP